MKRNSIHKITDFNTASCYLLVVCHSFLKRSFPDSAMAVLKCQLSEPCCQYDLWIFQETERLNGVCEQTDAAWLMATWTGCVPENGAVCMVLKCQWLHHAGLGRQAGNTMYTTVMVQLKF